jgi:hypothetical protein
VLGVAADCSGASCLGSSTRLSSGGTYSDVLCSAVVSTVIGSIGSALGAAYSLVAIVAADDGLPPTASCSGISVDAELQFDKSTVDDAYYYLPLLLMLSEVCIYLHVCLAMCG